MVACTLSSHRLTLSRTSLANIVSEDGSRASAGVLYRYSFSEHALRVTDVVTGHGLCNSIIISTSEDRICKVR
ncbi:unnamed protein product [Musa acuminata subsp. burmannicoides]